MFYIAFTRRIALHPMHELPGIKGRVHVITFSNFAQYEQRLAAIQGDEDLHVEHYGGAVHDDR